MTAAAKLHTPPFSVICDSADRKTWLDKRRFGIGASESPAVLGVSPWGSALELWAEKLGKVERRDLSDSEHVFWGLALEESIVRGYAARTGRAAVPFGIMLRSERWPWLTATPDALTSDCATGEEWAAMRRDIADIRGAIANGLPLHMVTVAVAAKLSDGRWWPLQTKNIGFGSAEDWADGVPDYYRVQCAHEALVCGSRKVTGAALIAGQRLAWDDIDVDANGLTERRIVNLTQAFVRDHLETGAEPPADGSESASRALGKLYPRHDAGKRVVLGASLMEASYDLDSAKAAMRDAKARVEELENKIKQAIGDAEIALFPDGSGYTFKTQKRAAMNVAASEFRVLRRKKAKEEG